jgi:type I restriction enzyme M protein
MAVTLFSVKKVSKLLPERASGEDSWRVPIEEIKAKNYDIKAVNPNRKRTEDHRTPEELLSIIESQGEEIKKVIARLREIR